MRILNLPLFVLFIFSFNSNHAQVDTLKVVSYNLLNFPSLESHRIDTLKGITQYLNPDIFMICELTSEDGANDILNQALNVDGITSYEMAEYNNGPGTDNELYYNSDKLGLKSQFQISTPLRNISEYILYYKSADIATTGDTVFFYVYVCHLKAGTGYEGQRLDEASAMKARMASHPNMENIIIGGDFNFYASSTEPAWDEILTGDGIITKDPINSPGSWNSNVGYAPIHTQSTRTTSLPDNGSTGGMDSRFDFIFLGNDAMNGSNDVLYIDGTYRAVGQDGYHYNKALLDAPANASEPANIISNLYYMSDHLPIYLELEVVSFAAGVEEKTADESIYWNAAEKWFKIIADGFENNVLTYEIYGINGQLISEGNLQVNTPVQTNGLDSGVYFIVVPEIELRYKFVNP